MTEPDEGFKADQEFEPEDGDPEERGVEAPLEDTAEQAVPADPGDVPVDVPTEVHRGSEVNEADAVEQSQVVYLEDQG
jgi:hypothetical protein